MKKKLIFLLGGSPLQVDLLRKAKERYHVVIIDGNAECALRSEADEFFHLDFSDTNRLYEFAVIKSPFLIMTMASEPGNLSAAIVSAKLGLKYNSTEVVYSTINKVRMKKLLTDSRLPTARYISVMSSEQSIALRDELTFPLVVKPSQSSAGRGVKLVNFIRDLEVSVAEAQAISKDGCALVEEFIPGDQYSVETISCEGNHYVLGITREYFGPPPFFAETQQMFPADLDSVLESRIKDLILTTLDFFEIQYGACHVELRVAPWGGLYIIEIASRIGGWRSELIKKSIGLDYADLLLRSYETNKLLVEKKKESYCLVKMIFGQADVEREQVLRRNKAYNVSPVTWLKNSFGQVQNSLMDSAGYYFIEAENIEDALNAL
ncbi:ATP-grasp domain-containing protein [Pseudomonas stutzeri]|uniref:ATP-grasp domain-containing protein n=1 Tax=Stutzerimonas stutzeri TaxID=316 RepID=UPI00190A3918|nr:ATP-grasp domain-containing protein [Stutzerimonas stutzeri]MBK3866156.1 ATP-grasp domain-containing protein [Stutzerimonas stutzeri]